MRVYRRENYRSMPWKNGMGRTEEILIAPEGAGVEAFDLRLSMAHVGSDGPFSRFPGVDRSIFALEGGGMWLDVEGREPVCLAPGGAPFAFSGDLVVSSRNIKGPTLDLNLMTRRGRFRHVMRVEHVQGTAVFVASTETYLIPDRALAVNQGCDRAALRRFDCLQLDAREDLTISARDPVDLVVMEVFRDAL